MEESKHYEAEIRRLKEYVLEIKAENEKLKKVVEAAREIIKHDHSCGCDLVFGDISACTCGYEQLEQALKDLGDE